MTYLADRIKDTTTTTGTGAGSAFNSATKGGYGSHVEFAG